MLVRTDSEDPIFKKLRDLLDKELWEMYPVVMEDYFDHNLLPEPVPALVYFIEEKAAAIGAFKEMKDMDAIEIKRMFVLPDFRGRALGKVILEGLENWGRELGYAQAILETGLKNFAAHKLYERTGYDRIENYGPFVGMEESLCYGKKL